MEETKKVVINNLKTMKRETEKKMIKTFREMIEKEKKKLIKNYDIVNRDKWNLLQELLSQLDNLKDKEKIK